MRDQPRPPRMTELIRTVRQARQYRPDPVPDDVLAELLEIARWTGSSRNSQPWHFIVVTDKEQRPAKVEVVGPLRRDGARWTPPRCPGRGSGCVWQLAPQYQSHPRCTADTLRRGDPGSGGRSRWRVFQTGGRLAMRVGLALPSSLQRRPIELVMDTSQR